MGIIVEGGVILGSQKNLNHPFGSDPVRFSVAIQTHQLSPSNSHQILNFDPKNRPHFFYSGSKFGGKPPKVRRKNPKQSRRLPNRGPGRSVFYVAFTSRSVTCRFEKNRQFWARTLTQDPDPRGHSARLGLTQDPDPDPGENN